MSRRDVALIAVGLIAGFALIVLAFHSAYKVLCPTHAAPQTAVAHPGG